jgi:hypothetical protein
MLPANEASPLPWGEGGERSEPGKGSLPFQEGKTLVQFTNSGLLVLPLQSLPHLAPNGGGIVQGRA